MWQAQKWAVTYEQYSSFIMCLGTQWATNDVCNYFTLVGLTASACLAYIVVKFMGLGNCIPYILKLLHAWALDNAVNVNDLETM